MSTTEVSILLDEDDYRDVNCAIAVWQCTVRDEKGSLLPEGDSDTAGAVLAEICRDWLETHGTRRSQ